MSIFFAPPISSVYIVDVPPPKLPPGANPPPAPAGAHYPGRDVCALEAPSLVSDGVQGADLRATEAEHANAVTGTEHARTTDRGIRLASAGGVRRLTPTECERLQGFPDGYTDIGGTPDGKRYHALGDAVTTNVAQFIGERLRRAENA